MFTGIVQGKASILEISGTDNLKTLKIGFPDGALKNISKGASIAINGTCLTATAFDLEQNWANFDVILETLKLTNLGSLQESDQVNFERAAAIGDEIGGHLMSGHIHCSVEICKIDSANDVHTVYFTTPENLQKYLLPKGFAGLNGCSLTLGEVSNESFSVHLIPETLEVTTFGELKVDDAVNLEIDPQTQTIVDTVERFMSTKKPA